jgi:hypothetical protein
MRKALFFLTALFVLAGQANAQRRLPKMKGIQLTAGMADGFYDQTNRNKTGYYFGTALSSYTKGGDKWVFGGEFLLKYYPYKSIGIPIAQYTAEGGYYWNFISDAGKTFILSVGGSALAGYESVNRGEKLLFDGSTLTNDNAFIYGGAATLDLECYFTNSIVLLLNARERCLWGGSTGHFHTQFGAGIKFIL